MKKLFIAIMFALGLAMTPALAGTDTICEGNFEDFAANAVEDYIVISGPSLDAFAGVVKQDLDADKPAEITAIAIPADMDDQDGSGTVAFYTFMADNCPFSIGAGYVPTLTAKNGTAAAMVVDDKVVILKANPNVQPKPMGLGI